MAHGTCLLFTEKGVAEAKFAFRDVLGVTGFAAPVLVSVIALLSVLWTVAVLLSYPLPLHGRTFAALPAVTFVGTFAAQHALFCYFQAGMDSAFESAAAFLAVIASAAATGLAAHFQDAGSVARWRAAARGAAMLVQGFLLSATAFVVFVLRNPGTALAVGDDSNGVVALVPNRGGRLASAQLVCLAAFISSYPFYLRYLFAASSGALRE